MNKSESISNLALALNKVQASMGKAKKSSNNPFFKSRYADLSSVWEACGEALAENDLCISQMPCESFDGFAGLETILMHKSGEWISSVMHMPLSKRDPQGLGSAITYARRYALAAIVGVTQEDDDGEAAMGRNEKHSKKENVDVDSVLDGALLDISQCKDLNELKNVFSKAHTILVKNGAEGHANRLIGAKDIRKEELK